MINLGKGGRINLSKGDTALTIARVGLGWQANTFDGDDFDPDVSAFVLDENGKALGEPYFIFYNNPRSPEGAVVHSGDDRKGATDTSSSGDQETITVDISKLPAAAVEVTFVVTIYEAEARKQNFGMMRKSYIRISDGADPNSKPTAEYRLEDEHSSLTAVQFGSLRRGGGEWHFVAVGDGYKRGLADFVRAYGLNC